MLQHKNQKQFASSATKPHLASSCRLQLLELQLQDESQLQKTLQRANLEAAAAAQQQTALKQHVIQ